MWVQALIRILTFVVFFYMSGLRAGWNGKKKVVPRDGKNNPYLSHAMGQREKPLVPRDVTRAK